MGFFLYMERNVFYASDPVSGMPCRKAGRVLVLKEKIYFSLD